MDFLIVGLGNPGKDYEQTRHNIGFMILDNLADRADINISKKGFKGLYDDINFSEHKLLLFKPQTYMNLSGQAVKEIKNFYKIDTKKIIVVHDEIDLELGKIKIKEGGGSAGHNGIKSIFENIGDKNFKRVRVGIGRPRSQMNVSSHVLSKFTGEEKEILESQINSATEAVLEIISNGLTSAMNKFNKNISTVNKEEPSHG